MDPVHNMMARNSAAATAPVIGAQLLSDSRREDSVWNDISAFFGATDIGWLEKVPLVGAVTYRVLGDWQRDFEPRYHYSSGSDATKRLS